MTRFLASVNEQEKEKDREKQSMKDIQHVSSFMCECLCVESLCKEIIVALCCYRQRMTRHIRFVNS